MKPFAYLTIAGLALCPALAFAAENEQAVPAATSAGVEAAPAPVGAASSPSQPAAEPAPQRATAAEPEHANQKAHAASRADAKAKDEKKKEAELQKPALSKKAYAHLVAAEIRRHTPKSADNKAGSVSISFTIGASGRIVSQKVQSSSDPALEPIVRRILASVQAPPPPGGSFSAVQAFNFR